MYPALRGIMSGMMPSENASGADNEQGSLAEIAWLAGLLDGDGWIGLIRAKRTGKDYYRYTASLALMSTSWPNTEKSQAVLDSLGVNTYLANYAAYVGKDGSPRRQKWAVSLRGNKDTAVALRLIRPYLAEKRTCADIVIEYVEWRESYPKRPGGHAENVVRDMRERAERAMALLRADRTRQDPSETTRQALPIL